MANFAITPTETTFSVQVGENTLAAANSATAAAASAADAAQSAAYAGGFEAPEYASQSAGEAALTTVGLVFRVPKGTTPESFDWYRIDAPGSSELVDPLITNSVLPFEFGSGTGPAASEIDLTAAGSYVFGSRDGSFVNKLGVNNTKPTVEPLTGARAVDTGYIAGTAQVAAILAGYNNVNNSLACFIASQHSMIYSGTDHASIIGGSLNTLRANTSYSSIWNSTSCTIQERGRYATIISSDQCQLLTGGSDAASGFRSFMGSSLSSTIGGRNSVVLCGVAVTNAGQYCTVLNGNAVTVGATTSNTLVVGSNHTIGNTLAANNSLVVGNAHTVNGGRSLVIGDSHNSNSKSWCNLTGTGALAPFDGAMCHTSRNRDGVTGNNQSLDFVCSQETTDATVVRLSLAGSSTFPTQPNNSVVTGALYVTAAKDDGTTAAWRIDFSSVMGASGSPTIKGAVVTELHDDLTLTDPAVVATTSIYRVQVTGLAATNIRWQARFVGQQVVFG